MSSRPLNPVLGEVFYGTWPNVNNRGTTTLLVEQVSHHPPITAYVIENKQKGLRLVGHNAQKTSFSAGSIIVKQLGHAVLNVGDEQYLITLPRLRIDGLWYGSPYIELTETSYIIGGGNVTTIEYKGKGYFSGKSHTFKATMTPVPGQGGAGPKETVVEGTWHESSKFTKGVTGNFYEVVPGAKEEARPLEWSAELGEEETRRLWFLVAKGIREGDFDLASREKTRIEVKYLCFAAVLLLIASSQNDQRQRRKDEQAEGKTWQLKHFERVESDPTCKSSFSSLGVSSLSRVEA